MRVTLHIFHCACAKRLYFHFRSKIWRHHRVSRPRFPVGRRNFGDSRTFKTQLYGCHRLRSSASPKLAATGFVNGKGQFSNPPGDYVGDPYGCAKLGAYPSTGGFWAHGWIITKIIFIYTFFEELTYRSDPSTDFHALWLKRRGLAQGCAFLGFFSHCSPFRGSTPPPKKTILGRE